MRTLTYLYDVYFFLTIQTPFAAGQYVIEINLTVSAKPIRSVITKTMKNANI